MVFVFQLQMVCVPWAITEITAVAFILFYNLLSPHNSFLVNFLTITYYIHIQYFEAHIFNFGWTLEYIFQNHTKKRLQQTLQKSLEY